MEAVVAMVAATLAVAGVAKLVEPRDARALLVRLGVQVPPVAVRVAGLAEVAVAVTVVVEGGRVPAAALAVAHLVFAGVVVAVRRSGDVACGCFGARSTAPPGAVHLVANLVSLAVAVVAIVEPVRPLDLLTRSSSAGALAAAAVVVLGAWLLVELYTDAAEAAHAARRLATVRLERGSAAPTRGHRR